MFGRKFHLVIVGVLTLLSLSLSLISEIPKIFGKVPEVVAEFRLLGWPVVLTDRHLLWLRIEAIFLVVIITLIVQYKQVYKPFMKFDELRAGAFDHVFGAEIDKLHKNLTDELRFSVMQKTTYLKWSRFIHIGRLRQIYNYGYHHDHRDKALRFWFVKFFRYVRGEGVVATAFITEQAMIADLRDPAVAPARLTGWKLELTRDIMMVMSFPVFRWNGDRYSCLGTINIDLRDRDVVATLVAEPTLRRLTKLAQYFQDCTEYVSLWL